MDWKYKHFNQAAVIKAAPASVLEAARAVVGEAFPQIDSAPDGFVARGHSAWHAAIATVHIEPAPEGARVAVELLVERAAGRYFMLWDVGGYYNGQLHKWLSAISQRVGQAPLPLPGASRLRRGCFAGCLVYFLAGMALTVVVLPLDQALFGQGGGPLQGIFVSVAAGLGLLAGIAAFLYVLNTDAPLQSLRARLPGGKK